MALAGIGIAYHFFVRKPEAGEAVGESLGPVRTLLLNKYYVDEVYSAVFVDGPVFGKGMGSVLSSFDAAVVDGGVNGAGWFTRGVSSISMLWDRWVIDFAVNAVGFTVGKILAFPMRMIQTGFVQNYALVIVLGVVALGYYFIR